MISQNDFADKDELFRRIRESVKKYGNMPNELPDQVSVGGTEDNQFKPAPPDYDLLRIAIGFYKVMGYTMEEALRDMMQRECVNWQLWFVRGHWDEVH